MSAYTALSLARYDGTNEKLPIYIALDGYVYDVTPGKEFYIPGGAYHSIAGKDGSSELHSFGGNIIKEKYKIVGVFLDK
ncbi:MAG: cytochrome B5 [Candidatus Yonathbacteria bacterium]|nr:cytochrome B5 [Candidatus Yonathbacteria bacterium]